MDRSIQFYLATIPRPSHQRGIEKSKFKLAVFRAAIQRPHGAFVIATNQYMPLDTFVPEIRTAPIESEPPKAARVSALAAR